MVAMYFLEDNKGRVDKETATVFNVRICGRFSGNGRVYSAECLRQAIPMVEGCKVRCNHPKNPMDARSTSDTLGWLENVRQGRDGALYGDLRLLRSHPMCSQILEAAERNPRLYGLSWNADGDFGGQDAEGRDQVLRLSHLRGVDLVDDPATNESLFEGITVATVRQLINANRRMGRRMKVRLKEQAERSGLGGAVPVMEPGDEAGAGEWRQCVADCLGKLVASADPRAHEIAAKLMRELKPEEGDDVGPDEDEDEDEGVPAPPPDEMAEDDDDRRRDNARESRRPRRPARGSRSVREAATDAESFLERITGKPTKAEVDAFVRRIRGDD
jgi:hypothetical protein